MLHFTDLLHVSLITRWFEGNCSLRLSTIKSNVVPYDLLSCYKEHFHSEHTTFVLFFLSIKRLGEVGEWKFDFNMENMTISSVILANAKLQKKKNGYMKDLKILWLIKHLKVMIKLCNWIKSVFRHECLRGPEPVTGLH